MTQRVETKKEFIPHLHAFRGVAILTILGAHAWSFMIFMTGGIEGNAGLTWLFHAIESLFHGSTLYFAFISGLLFSLVLQAKGWKVFFANKGKYVLAPYVFLSVLLVSASWPMWVENSAAQGQTIEYLPILFESLLMGWASPQFWYIPILMCLYAATPILALGTQSKVGLYALIVVSLVPLVISRTMFPNFISLQTVIYFMGAYAGGMVIGLHYDKVIDWCQQVWKTLLFLAVVITGVILMLYHWGIQKGEWHTPLQTLIYLQKISIGALFLVLLKAKEESLPKLLSTLGTYAFPIYFLHLFFMMMGVQAISDFLTENRDPALIFVLGLVNYVLSIVLSVLAAKLIQRMIPKYSKWVIGV